MVLIVVPLCPPFPPLTLNRMLCSFLAASSSSEALTLHQQTVENRGQRGGSLRARCGLARLWDGVGLRSGGAVQGALRPKQKLSAAVCAEVRSLSLRLLLRSPKMALLSFLGTPLAEWPVWAAGRSRLIKGPNTLFPSPAGAGRGGVSLGLRLRLRFCVAIRFPATIPPREGSLISG